MNLEQVREVLEEYKEGLLTSPKTEFCEANKRDDVLYTFRKFEEVLEAAFLVKSMRLSPMKE